MNGPLTNLERAILRDVVLLGDRQYWERRAHTFDKVGLKPEALACRRRASQPDIAAAIWAETFADALEDTTWGEDLADRVSSEVRRLNLTGPGRCHDCEFHVPTQGHAPTCSFRRSEHAA